MSKVTKTIRSINTIFYYLDKNGRLQDVIVIIGGYDNGLEPKIVTVLLLDPV